MSQRTRADLIVALNEQQLHRTFVKKHAPRTVMQIIETGLSYESTELRNIHRTLEETFDYISLWGVNSYSLWLKYSVHIDRTRQLQVLLDQLMRNAMTKEEEDENVNEDLIARTMALVHAPPAVKPGEAWEGQRDAIMRELVDADADALKRALLRVVDLAGTEEDASLRSFDSPRSPHGVGPEPLRAARPMWPNWLSCLCGGNGATAPTPRPRVVPGRLPPQAAGKFENASFVQKFGIGLYELQFQHKIGSGAAGTTYAADFKGKRVAVKVAGSSEVSLDGWEAEVVVLGYLNHVNVVSFLGAVMEPPTHCLVMEFCEGGDLGAALTRSTPKGFFMRMARGIASGMEYLHSKSILHRDLKSSNVLLSADLEAKVTDLGLSVALRTEDDETIARAHVLTSEIGTYRWMAPEVLRHEWYVTSADVFSYSMVLFEILTHQLPHADRTPLKAALSNATGDGERPRLPEGVPPAVRALVEACWDSMPHRRPAFTDIVRRLDAIEAELTPEERAWLDAPEGHPVYTKAEIEAASNKKNSRTAELETADSKRSSKKSSARSSDHGTRSTTPR